ncbi:HK97 family phage prohead protease [Noviherbaspirillum suwonense]|uniref:Prohead serine protease domain-containing protein n=1 Tax=Noviherbaspirillum suwonense TaxID=1224511 RepID=A0ABY1QK56_9BURK|nr:HK97 family phage prohead protease [Noviherbaspirillum suwonense]SMP71917.1 prohead peptidase. Unknown type peptidase. MEROPS family U35 [Noviherbaspirillum suwonense]
MKRKSASGLQTRDFNFDIKAVEKDGFFSGYGSVFGVKDSYGEIVAPGAFKASINARAERGRKLPILWQHRSGEPLGVYEVVKEDSTGLYMEGRLLVNDVAQAKEAQALMKAGAVTGLSIGYYVKADSWNEKDKVRTLTEVDLQETSIVTFPANDEARVEVVKSMEHIIKAGRMPTLAEFEDFLRDSGGFSKSQATVIAGRGLRELLSRSESGSDPSDALQLLKSFSLK